MVNCLFKSFMECWKIGIIRDSNFPTFHFSKYEDFINYKICTQFTDFAYS
jgi:hypothetical protein